MWRPKGLDIGATQTVASDSVCCSEGFPVEESVILTCHADISSASALTECQGLSGPVESLTLSEE